MRGRSSSAKARLRSAGYKCNLCGRRLIDAASLERHQKTIHNVSPKEHKVNKVTIKSKAPAVRSKPTNREKEKIFTNLRKDEVLEQAKPKLKINKNNNDNENVNNTLKVFAGEGNTMINKKVDFVENGESEDEKDKSKKIDEKDTSRQIHFECPVCARSYSVYFNAHKHIQKAHLLELDTDLRPIRVEQCYRCDKRMRSDEEHTCPKNIEQHISVISEFVCTGCNQIFVSLKSFDCHVAGLHSDAVDSMFFPSKLEFMTWRLEMERQTNAKYILYGEYESKKIYRCSYARNHTVLEKYTAYFCPSSIVVQEFSKGIQVHYYNKHFDHTYNPYTLSSKYKKYSITWFLKGAEENVATAAKAMKIDDKELFPQFKKLMNGIITNAAEVDVSVLKKLIEKALEMSAVVTEAAANEATSVKTPKNMSDKEITEELGMKTHVEKRRRSVDSYETPPKPAKRMRNKSLFNQSQTKMSPKIVNAFSLASNSSNGDDDFDSLRDNTETEKLIQNKNTQDSDTVTPKYTRMSTRLSGLSESLSFNDSYKDFIDRNFISKSDDKKESKMNRNTVKTKLGEFKQTSPRNVEIKEDTTQTPVVNRKLRALLTNKGNNEETFASTNIIQMDTSKSNMLSVETPNITITKVCSPKVDSLKVSSSQSTPKVNTLKTKGFSQSIDPLQTTVTRSESSISESKVSRVNTRNTSAPLVDPLELNITKSKPGNFTPVPLSQRNIAKVNSRIVSSPLIDPLQVTTKINTKVDPIKNAPKVYSGPKTNSPGTPKIAPKVTPQILPKLAPKITPTVVPKVTPKITPKVTFEDKPTTSSGAKLTPPKKIKDIKYEVREQENDCNILVLKF